LELGESRRSACRASYEPCRHGGGTPASCMCSFNRKPGAARESTRASVAVRAPSGARRRSSPSMMLFRTSVVLGTPTTRCRLIARAKNRHCAPQCRLDLSPAAACCRPSARSFSCWPRPRSECPRPRSAHSRGAGRLSGRFNTLIMNLRAISPLSSRSRFWSHKLGDLGSPSFIIKLPNLFLTDRKVTPVFAIGPLERLASLSCVRPFRPLLHGAATGAALARTLLWSPDLQPHPPPLHICVLTAEDILIEYSSKQRARTWR
jgi:hypothetical protein